MLTRLAAAALVAMLLATLCCACRRGREDKEEKEPPPTPREPVLIVEGTPWEPVINTQSSLMDLFSPEGDARKVLWAASKFKKKKIDQFRKDCQAALLFYAEDPARRIEYVTHAGSAWVTVGKHVRNVSSKWSVGDKREVEVLLNQFQCK